MQQLAQGTLQIYDMGYQIQLRIRYRRAWLERFVGFGAVSIFLNQAIHTHNVWIFAMGTFGLAGLIADLLHGEEIKVEITASEMKLSGNVGRLFSTRKRLSNTTITDIGYTPGSEDREAGLYVSQSWAWTCILPHISEAQAAEVRDLILSRFPALAEQMTSDSLLFGKGSEPIALNLK